MKDELRELLGSNDSVVKEKQEKRRQLIYNIINNFLERAKENEDFNIGLVKLIINRYLIEKEKQIYDGENEYNTSFYSHEVNIEDNYLLVNYYDALRLSDYSEGILSDDDELTITLLNNCLEDENSLPPIFKNADEDNLLVLKKDKEKFKPAIFNIKAFRELGFEFIYAKNDRYFIQTHPSWKTIEKFIEKALNNDLGNGLVLSEEYINTVKEKVNKLKTAYDAIAPFKLKSIENANILALDICKRLINKYQETDVSVYPNNTIKYYIPFIYEEFLLGKNLDKDDLTHIDKLLEFCRFEPDIIAVLYEDENGTRYLPMIENDIKRVLNEININFSTFGKNNEINISIEENSLEEIIQKIAKRKKDK